MGDGRLDSWKEIAQYLKRDVSTVRRWEMREGLPVHRHVHDKLGSVFAYPAEIDEWLQGRRQLYDANGAALEPPENRTSELPKIRSTRFRERIAWALAVAGLLSTATLLVWPQITAVFTSHPESRRVRYLLTPPARTVAGGASISPDGEFIAFTASAAGQPTTLWIQALDSIAPQSLPRTTGATSPFWSHDSRHIGFFADGKLKRIDVSKRVVQTICDAPEGRGGSWSQFDVILFAPARERPLFRVAASGGPVTRVTALEGSGRPSHVWPEFLPDGQHFLYLDYRDDPKLHGVYVGDLTTGKGRQLVRTFSSASYAADHLLYRRGSDLVAHAFDAGRLALSGTPIAVAPRVLSLHGGDHKLEIAVS